MENQKDETQGMVEVPGVKFSKPLEEYVKGFFIKVTDPKTGKVQKRRVTKRQLRFVQYLVQGLKPTDAARKAGFSEKNSSMAKVNIMQTSVVKSLLMSMVNKFEDAGITQDYVVAKFKEWFEAKKVIAARVIHKKGDQMKEADSMTNDFIDVPDYDTQLKAYDRYKNVVDEKDSKKTARKLTIEEFIDA